MKLRGTCRAFHSEPHIRGGAARLLTPENFAGLCRELAIDFRGGATGLELEFQETFQRPILAREFHEIRQRQLLRSIRLQISRLAGHHGGCPIRMACDREWIQRQKGLSVKEGFAIRLELHIVEIHAGGGQSDPRLHLHGAVFQESFGEIEVLGRVASRKTTSEAAWRVGGDKLREVEVEASRVAIQTALPAPLQL